MGLASIMEETHRGAGMAEAPSESLAVVELDPAQPPVDWAFLAAVREASGAHELVLVCPAVLLIGSTPPSWATVVPIPPSEPVTWAEARRLAVAQATGDLIRICGLGELRGWMRGEPAPETGSWAERLHRRGADRPSP